MYYISGNGTFDANTGGPDYGDSFVRLNGSLQVQDYFTPYNQLCLSQGDVDLGAGGPLVIPSANVVISAGKEGRPYVVSTTSMGKYTADPNLVCGGTDANNTTIDKVQQELPPGTVGSLFSTPALWTSPTGTQDVYFTQSNGPTRAFTFSGGKLSTAATSSSSGNGGDPVVSSNGTTAGTGIVWDQDYGGELHALNPTNLAVEYWNSGMNSSPRRPARRSQVRDADRRERRGVRGTPGGPGHLRPARHQPAATAADAHRPGRDRRQCLGGADLDRELGCHQLQHLPRHHLGRRGHHAGRHDRIDQLSPIPG